MRAALRGAGTVGREIILVTLENPARHFANDGRVVYSAFHHAFSHMACRAHFGLDRRGPKPEGQLQDRVIFSTSGATAADFNVPLAWASLDNSIPCFQCTVDISFTSTSDI